MVAYACGITTRGHKITTGGEEGGTGISGIHSLMRNRQILTVNWSIVLTVYIGDT